MCQHTTTAQYRKKEKRFKRKRNHVVLKQIHESLEILSSDPTGESKHLKGNYKGKRSHRPNGIRIIFAYCKECRELKHTIYNKCKDCETYPDQNLMLFDVDDRGHSYK